MKFYAAAKAHMQTILTKSPVEAAEFIKRGGIAAFPTETVYGLGADIFNENAVARIFEAKRRPMDNPMIAHVGEVGQIILVASEISSNARKFIKAFFPGPLTIVLPKSANVPLTATAGLETIGVRMPRNTIAREFLTACGIPLAAPSANISGRPSPTTWEAVYEDLNGRIDCILQGEATEIGLESTVVDCTTEAPMILRAGAVSLEQLQMIVSATTFYKNSSYVTPPSPGLKHKHYAPAARVVLIDPEFKVKDSKPQAYIGLDFPNGEFGLIKICASVEEYAAGFFAFFRECDKRKIETIFCQKVSEAGIGAALMDRLRRAAAG